MGQRPFVWEHNINIRLWSKAWCLVIWNRNICIAISFPGGKQINGCCISTQICTELSGWGRWCFTCPVSVLPFFFFFFSFIAWTLIELTAAIITSSEPAPDPPISSCEKAQFCLSFPKRKHIIACKTRSSARDDWASQRLQRCHLKSWRVPPKKKKPTKNKKKNLFGWKCLFEISKAILLYPHSMRLVAPVYSPDNHVEQNEQGS